MNQIDAVLEKHELKKTPLRRKILKAFVNAKASMSQADLIQSLSRNENQIDRVSVYRNLSQLKDAGVLHEVEINNYIFCSHECEKHAHLLLFCQACGKHMEIKDHARIDQFMKAVGQLDFFSQRNPIFLRGVCTACS